MNERYWTDEARKNDGLTHRGHYHRRIAEQEEEFVVSQLLPHQANILEIGPGTGRFTRHLLTIADQVLACDVDPHALLLLEQRAEDPASLRCIDVPVEDLRTVTDDNSFDAIVAMRVIPYLDDWEQVLDHLVRMVKPDGILIFDLWNERSFEGWWQRFRATPVEIVPHFVDGRDMLTTIDSLPVTIEATYRWGYFRIGSLSLDTIGSLLFPNHAFSATFCCRKRGQ